jgi:L-asparaginase II
MTVLLEVVRNGRVESEHRGRLILLDPSGDVAVSDGPVDEPVLPRSSLKPLQAVALVEHGYPGQGALLALAAASHDGEDVHIAGARAILAAAGLDEDAL